MIKNNILSISLMGLLAFGMTALPLSDAAAAGDAPKVEKQDWPHKGIFGKFDRASVQRGYQVYKEVCAACHAMKYLRFRDLAGIGFSEMEIKALAAQYEIEDGPNNEGEMFMRPGKPADRFVSPFPNEKAARYANGGAYPKDLSLIIKARSGGEDYLYALLTSYRDHPPEGETLADGQYWNDAYKGHKIAMAAPLSDGQLTYSDGTEATMSQMARDVAQFLAYASEPHMEQRKATGLMVILFLSVFAGVMYGVKKKIWEDLDH